MEVVSNKDSSGNMTVRVPYKQGLIAKVKTIPGHKWHNITHSAFAGEEENVSKTMICTHVLNRAVTYVKSLLGV